MVTFCLFRLYYYSPNWITGRSKELLCLLSPVCCKKAWEGEEKGKKNDLKTEKTETGKPNFTNSQTDIGYMGEVGMGGGGGVSCCAFQTRSRRQWWKQAWTVCCSSILLADKTTSRWRCQNIWVWHMAVLQVWHTHSSQLVCPEDKPFCDLGLMIWNCM